MECINEMRLEFRALPENEAFARLAVSGFLLPLDPTMEALADVKTAVSEAVPNAIVHAYPRETGAVRLHARYDADGVVVVDVTDRGCGIADVALARQPFYTTGDGEERSGMGFTVMESFMDAVDVRSVPGRGTSVRLTKRIAPREASLPRQA